MAFEDGECVTGQEIVILTGDENPGTDEVSRVAACAAACRGGCTASFEAVSGFGVQGFSVDPGSGTCKCVDALSSCQRVFGRVFSKGIQRYDYQDDRGQAHRATRMLSPCRKIVPKSSMHGEDTHSVRHTFGACVQASPGCTRLAVHVESAQPQHP